MRLCAGAWTRQWEIAGGDESSPLLAPMVTIALHPPHNEGGQPPLIDLPDEVECPVLLCGNTTTDHLLPDHAVRGGLLCWPDTTAPCHALSIDLPATSDDPDALRTLTAQGP